MKQIFQIILFVILGLPYSYGNNFVRIKNNQFYRNNKPYYFIGTNFWYAPILGINGSKGNRERLIKELNTLQKNGINNLRILVGSEAGNTNVPHLEPFLQKNNKINLQVLDGLDYLIFEMGKRKMVGVFYFTNFWDWSGGVGYYLKMSGGRISPSSTGNNWQKYCDYAIQMYTNKKAQKKYWNYIKKIILRTNKYTNRKYKDEPSIMAWQICNEPRVVNILHKQKMVNFIRQTSKVIKNLDNHHLLSIGDEGLVGYGNDYDLYEQIYLDTNIDYITIHIWPKNWNWTSNDRLLQALPNVYLKSNDYIEASKRLSLRLSKPIVIEEFGYPRDKGSFSPESSVKARNLFFDFIFNKVVSSKNNNDCIGGCNFWAWAGIGRANRKFDFTGDPPHEPQGWYSIFSNDTSTIELILNYENKLR